MQNSLGFKPCASCRGVLPANDRHSSCSFCLGKDTWRTTLYFYHPFLPCTRETGELLQSVTVLLLSKPSLENIWGLLSRMSHLFLWFLRGCYREIFPSFSEASCKTVRKRLTDTKNESFLSSEWFVTQTPGRSLRVNLEYAVKNSCSLSSRQSCLLQIIGSFL